MNVSYRIFSPLMNGTREGGAASLPKTDKGDYSFQREYSPSTPAPMILPYVTWDHKSFPTSRKTAATGDKPKSSSVLEGGRVRRGDSVRLE
ncbi:MAG: hypothetical protein DMG84_17965 [Acidobacteria bacterium]|nr:MAG: hypothetical protein DMG84_17965 [Acidobacteriota bacterium]